MTAYALELCGLSWHLRAKNPNTKMLKATTPNLIQNGNWSNPLTYSPNEE